MGKFFLILACVSMVFVECKVELGVDVFFKETYSAQIKGKRIGLVTNHTGVDSGFRSTVDLFISHAQEYEVVAFFCPEHGMGGVQWAGEDVEHGVHAASGLPIYSLHGKTRRPTEEMLKNIDVLIYDIQDVGVRAYTYATTLFYLMEEASKRSISVIVLDRPNPLGGLLVDGPMLEDKWRSFIGYINVPYCHGMTIGELALFFNKEYSIQCSLDIVPMRGWERKMIFADTGLIWNPTSPQVPEADTPFFQATTGILGELGLVNIGVGYTLPFKVVGAPWIDADCFARALNAQKLPGVRFVPFYYAPFFGLYHQQVCGGVRIIITNSDVYSPVAAQYMLMGILKSLYPEQVEKRLSKIDAQKKELFCKACGSAVVLETLSKEKYAAWKLMEIGKDGRFAFMEKRKSYLLY